MIARFGFVPSSVLRLRRGDLSASLHNLANERPDRHIGGAVSTARLEMYTTERGRERAVERQASGMFGGIRESAYEKDKRALSIMAAELVDFFVRYYAAPGETYLDPFAGHGVRMQVAALRGLRYEGMDVCAEFVSYMHAVADRLPPEQRELIRVELGDSRRPDHLADGAGDFCFTSPPYWDVEWYGPEPEQLGTGRSYDDFLVGMTDVWRAWLPKFKPGAWVVVNVNDIRRGGAFIPYHADTMRLMADAGYLPADVWIVEGLVSGLPRAFGVSFNLKRVAPKAHEYALVFRTPPL